MEIKNWTYEEYPSFDEEIEGVTRIPTTGDEKGTYIYSNVEYANMDGVPLHLQIITPQTRNTIDSDTLHPCLVYVQGSAWLEQNINAKLGILSRLAEKGYVIAVVEYRHSGIAPFPAQALDTRNAIRFMKIHAAEYNVDMDKVFVGGDSSGGHTAMFSQLLHDDDQDTNLYPGTNADVKGILSIHEDTILSPILMFHGTKDRTINPRVSVTVYQKLKSCGKDVRLYLRADPSEGTARYIRNDHATIHPGRGSGTDQQCCITAHLKRKCTCKCTVLGHCHYKWYIKSLRITCGTNRRLYVITKSTI